MATNLEDIQRNTRLRGHGVVVGPAVRESRLIQLSLLLLAKVEHVGDIILLAHAEARTEHGCSVETAEKLGSEVLLILLVVHGLR